MATNEDILRAIGRLEGEMTGIKTETSRAFSRMDAMDQNHEDHIAEDKRVHGEIHSRVNKLDKKQYAMVLLFSGLWAVILMGIKMAWDKLFS